MSYQQILIQGNLTREAEVRNVGQSQVATIGVAVSERFKKSDGTWGENTEYFDVDIWDKPNVNQYLTKGTSVLIVGKQKTNSWTDQSGQQRTTKRIRAEVIQLCGGKPQASAPQAQPSAPQGGYTPQPSTPVYQAPVAPSAPAPVAAPAPAPSGDLDMPF